ncbi:DeoR/GlpR family DNA-binding transcription regulator [Lysinibacillus capsici]|uniref:DeoR/GlpR family DNA-binding transcription regulator n=2 Tax=Bacillaceae TaxID=186817 RepID=UPI0021A75A90|nr:DeoR/GlpR family DNA-binding transcription regulator [Lysinibacillus capsici]MCT1540932.1 DeoR/GlpR family DNA-binding transcription regulator [Lysinibacillus capsici]MCT1572306.1 DeoR/GlpR family DNA-binding transcription regulator [Lysinibacillus capsici]MCT1649471.1 DeoR/GlpR family DNA-binding transcription regulator [Lysinibacillus capsici]MCT1727950.1 DeoR/GlpR family DNA-binding transcription regulator [Lysinibacillus capsici]MCT1785632.1 DeoR/GlpR family DNA-binding transcription re
MYMIERQHQILQFIRQHKVVKLVTLTKEFNVSMETIRRDVQQLMQDKKIEKFYGGVKYIEPVEGLIDHRLHEQLTEKIAIAKACALLVQDGECIFIDSGTTTYQMTPFLLDKEKLTVVTNSLPVAFDLIGSNIEVILLGGKVRDSEKSVTSNEFLFRFEHLNINKAFICASGVSIEKGISDFSLDEAITRKQIISISQKVYVATDSSKFNKDVAIQVCPVDDVDVIITDDALSKKTIQHFSEKGVQIKTVNMA